jgi:hypothetical protein
VTTEHESNLLPAAGADADGDVAAAGLIAGALDDEVVAGDAGVDGELQPASKNAAPHAMTEIPAWRRRMCGLFNKGSENGELTLARSGPCRRFVAPVPIRNVSSGSGSNAA